MKKQFIFSTALMTLLFSCSNPSTTEEQTSEMTTETTSDTTATTVAETLLKTVLDEKKAAFEVKADAEKKRIYAEGIQSVVDSKITATALQVGAKAIDFTLTNAAGKKISLYEQLKNGPVILTWYRGGWCPYCNLSLQFLQSYLPQYQAKGASLIALTPEIPDKSLSTKEKNELQFEVLSDVNNVIAKQYGIVFQLTKEVGEAYQKGFDLKSYNDNSKNELPLAATYVIGQDGIIKFAFLDADYRNRAEPKDILNALK